MINKYGNIKHKKKWKQNFKIRVPKVCVQCNSNNPCFFLSLIQVSILNMFALNTFHSNVDNVFSIHPSIHPKAIDSIIIIVVWQTIIIIFNMDCCLCCQMPKFIVLFNINGKLLHPSLFFLSIHLSIYR